MNGPTVRATCPACGDVQLSVGDLSIVVSGAPDAGGVYRFDCPSGCGPVSKRAEKRTIDLLVASGVDFVVVEESPEVTDPARFHAEPIGHDDVLDAHLLLADDRAFEQALNALEEEQR